PGGTPLLSAARLRYENDRALSSSLSATWCGRGRDRLGASGQREFYPGQLDRGQELQADDRRDGLRLPTPRWRGANRFFCKALWVTRNGEGHAGHGCGIRR